MDAGEEDADRFHGRGQLSLFLFVFRLCFRSCRAAQFLSIHLLFHCQRTSGRRVVFPLSQRRAQSGLNKAQQKSLSCSPLSLSLLSPQFPPVPSADFICPCHYQLCLSAECQLHTYQAC
ncbi:hypothetical protein COCON_G00157300 [Conger conger]|uniref:Uncharacterized protein n=1 Tax=Conger conger TaxID=82655 RepID=A0A9Q1HV86_CONCO|nr:hypothetical protein COCON_G00157300 [Conger conger]